MNEDVSSVVLTVMHEISHTEPLPIMFFYRSKKNALEHPFSSNLGNHCENS